MRREDVQSLLNEQPFVPFRVRLSNGNTSDVLHPDLVLTGRTSILIGIPAPDLPPNVYDRYTTVSLLHIAELIPLHDMTIPPPPANGSPQG
jgi:hypothetical protein